MPCRSSRFFIFCKGAKNQAYMQEFYDLFLQVILVVQQTLQTRASNESDEFPLIIFV
jgi:hypothetical protein